MNVTELWAALDRTSEALVEQTDRCNRLVGEVMELQFRQALRGEGDWR